VLIASYLHLKGIAEELPERLEARQFGKDPLSGNVKMMYELSASAQEGLMLWKPGQRRTRTNLGLLPYPKFMKIIIALHFVCDTIRMAAAEVSEHSDGSK